MCVSESICAFTSFSLAPFLLFALSCSGLFFFFYLFYLAIIFRYLFSNGRERNGVDLGGKGRGLIWEKLGEGNQNQNMLYEKKSILN